MKVITPTPLVAEAAEVRAEFRDLVVVVGAAAIEVALSGTDVAITPTRDVDVVVPVAEEAAIVSALEADGCDALFRMGGRGCATGAGSEVAGCLRNVVCHGGGVRWGEW